MSVRETTTVNERSRVYVYRAGDKLIERTYENVIDIRVSSSGNHYLRHKYDNQVVCLAIVAPGWIAIDILPAEGELEWTL